MLNTRIAIPKLVKQGDIFEIKTLVSHPMHTGFQIDNRGQFIPRNIIERFECRFDDEIIFAADFFPSVAANPFLSFHMKAQKSGDLVFLWREQNNQITKVVKKLNVKA